jgi:uncharacterized protein YdcH (DUF465 family)
MSDSFLGQTTIKFLISLLTAVTIALFGWVWKTTAKISIWKTLVVKMQEDIQETEERIKDRFTRTQADQLLKDLESQLLRRIDLNHHDSHEMVGRMGTQLSEKYNRLDDRLRELEKNPPASLQSDLQDLRDQIMELERELHRK